MKPPLENIHVSQRSRDILITLKRRTGIERWNVLCRWALCTSFSDPSRPIVAVHPADSNLEMSWEVFAGDYSETLLALFALRAKKDKISIERTTLANYFRSHLERGISQLQNSKSLGELFLRTQSKE